MILHWPKFLGAGLSMVRRREEAAEAEQPGRIPSHIGTIGQMRRKLESFPWLKALICVEPSGG